MKPFRLSVESLKKSLTVVIFTAVVESLAIATSKSVWTSGELHACDISKFDHS